MDPFEASRCTMRKVLCLNCRSVAICVVLCNNGRSLSDGHLLGDYFISMGFLDTCQEEKPIPRQQHSITNTCYMTGTTLARLRTGRRGPLPERGEAEQAP
jgi:hypothetical protein